MIYFKFPFNDALFTTDLKDDKENIFFHSFDDQQTISIPGNIVGIQPSNADFTTFNKKISSLISTDFVPETEAEYREKIQKLILDIKENQLPKVVLSRRIIKSETGFCAEKSFAQLCSSYQNAFRYIFSENGNCWMGAFSELLGKFCKKTGNFETMSLAGTLPVDEDWTAKEIEEQKPVSLYIQSMLRKFSDLVEISDTYDHISGNIKHLRTDFKAKIKAEDLHALIKELHPTPAVCGMPKDVCKNLIRTYEKFPRELYAGFIRIETAENIQYYVNLRCVKIFRNALHIFVGGGITAKSDPEKEWRETELKSQAILHNIYTTKKDV